MVILTLPAGAHADIYKKMDGLKLENAEAIKAVSPIFNIH